MKTEIPRYRPHRLPLQVHQPALKALAWIAAFMILPSMPALCSELVWVRQLGSLGIETGNGLGSDHTGIYVSGGTTGAFPGQTHLGNMDAIIQKYDFDGNEIWTHQFGTSADEYNRKLVVDTTGIYVVGSTLGTLPGQVHYGGGSDAYIRKYDPAGSILWTRQFGTPGRDFCYVIEEDSTGVYVAGHTEGTFPGQTASGSFDIYVRKYSKAGSVIWTRQFGTTSWDEVYGMTIDPTGLYLAGFTRGAFSGQTNAGREDVWIRKYSTNGTPLWTRQFGTNSLDVCSDLAALRSGVMMTGYTHGDLSGQGSHGSSDAFLWQYDIDGNVLSKMQFGTSGYDVGINLAIDHRGIHVSGYTNGTFPGQTYRGGWDAFVRSYESEWNEAFTMQFGTSGHDGCYGMMAHPAGILLTGLTQGPLLGQSQIGGQDMFLLKISDLPQEFLMILIDTIADLNLQEGIANSLDAKISNALAALEDLNVNNDIAAVNQLKALQQAVIAQSGKKISDAVAADLVEAAQFIIELIQARPPLTPASQPVLEP